MKFWMIYDNTALIYAAKYGYKEIVELLLKQEGIDINIKNILNQKHSWYFKYNFFCFTWSFVEFWKKVFT